MSFHERDQELFHTERSRRLSLQQGEMVAFICNWISVLLMINSSIWNLESFAHMVWFENVWRLDDIRWAKVVIKDPISHCIHASHCVLSTSEYPLNYWVFVRNDTLHWFPLNIDWFDPALLGPHQRSAFLGRIEKTWISDPKIWSKTPRKDLQDLRNVWGWVLSYAFEVEQIILVNQIHCITVYQPALIRLVRHHAT